MLPGKGNKGEHMTVAPLNAAKSTSTERVFHAPDRPGRVLLGRTLPSLLDEACINNPNARALNERVGETWHALSSTEFRDQAETLAAALQTSGLSPGERVAFYTPNDLAFCVMDMACLMAGLITVPLFTQQSQETLGRILDVCQPSALVVSDGALYRTIAPRLKNIPLKLLVLRDATGASAETLGIHQTQNMAIETFETLREKGEVRLQTEPDLVKALKKDIRADDIATIAFTSGATGAPKGVMLSHQNLTSNVMAAFSSIPELVRGQETTIAFMPLAHIFSRTLYYGYLAWGFAIYLSTPEKLPQDLKEVKPTLIATVPRLLERVFGSIIKAGAELNTMQRPIFDWAVELGKRFDPEHEPGTLYTTQQRAAAKLVYERWREVMGERLKLMIVGGSALRPELVRIFGAAGINVLQGYGLTESSPIISYNRAEHNRPGTVGQLVPGAEVKLRKDGEILTRGPQVMRGYFQAEDATHAVIDEGGWLHTGDFGEVSEDGYLTISGRLSDIFTLSTGERVNPQPLELALEAIPGIDHAFISGEGQAQCVALIFYNSGVTPEALEKPLRQQLKNLAKVLPDYALVKRVWLMPNILEVSNDLLTPTLKLRRPKMQEVFRQSLMHLHQMAAEGASSPTEGGGYIFSVDAEGK